MQLKRNPKYLQLENVTRKEALLASDKWNRVKQEMLGGVFESEKPACMVTDCIYFFTDHPELLDSGPITVHNIHVLNTEWDAFYMIKGKWSRDELDDVVTEYRFGATLLWMLPNMEKTLSEKEAQEFWAIVNMSEGNIDQNLLDKSELETIGCFFKGDSILWTNPSPEKVDLVVENLKKLCSELKVELKEI